jgi:putative colanic acid biosynthesis acetyltransferase WcaF
MILRLFGARIGKGVHVYPATSIWAPWNLSLEENVGVADRVILYSQAQIVVGKNTVISQGSHICTGTHDYKSRNFELIAKEIIIGKDVWLAAESFVGPGVVIGDNAVVGARAVVTKSIEGGWVYAGNPCRKIRPRGAYER